jgi:hypothetical protein
MTAVNASNASTAEKMPVMAQLLKKVWRKIYFKRTMIMFVHELAEGHRKIKVSSRFAIRQFTAADFPACDAHFASQVSAYADFLKRGFTGFTAFSTVNGEAGGMAWCTPTTFTDQFYGCTIELQDGEVFQMAGEVAEPYRNSPVTANIQFAAWDYWAAQGKKRVFTLIQDDNAASMKFSISAGYKEAGRAYVIHRLLGVRFVQIVKYDGERFAHHKKQNRHAQDRDPAQVA